MTATEYRRFMTAGLRAPAAAREFVRDKLSHGDRVDDVVLMVSELVTNAVRHGSLSRVSLRLIEDEERLRVEVQQLSKTDAPFNGDKSHGSGFGLKIVAALSDAWGTGDPDWTGVWFEIEA